MKKTLLKERFQQLAGIKPLYHEQKDKYGRTQADRDWEKGIDPRRPKDIEFDNAQAMSKLTPDDRDKVGKIQQMMAKEKGANFTDNLEKEIKEKFNAYSSIREEKPGMYRVKFSFVRREFEDKVWEEMLEFITNKGFEIDEKMTSNYYEPNYDREEPPEQVPMIYFSTEEQDDFEKGFMTEMLQRRAGIIK